MTVSSLEELAEALARNRAAGTVTDLPMSMLQSTDEAVAVQSAALDAYDPDFRGYTLVGTNPIVRSTLGLREPIFSAIPEKAFHKNLPRISLPRGVLGAQCELVMTIGKTYPSEGDYIDRSSAAGIVVACQPAIGLLGRRTRPAAESHLVAIADFAFHVATICGPSVRHIDPIDLDKIEMVARIDDNIVATATTGTILGYPLDAVTWLASKLSAEHRHLSVDDVIATGSCTPVLQVLPGQNLSVEFNTLGSVSCRFE
jgi:2-keto-4-pentenoate hydratase